MRCINLKLKMYSLSSFVEVIGLVYFYNTTLTTLHKIDYIIDTSNVTFIINSQDLKQKLSIFRTLKYTTYRKDCFFI